jgi:hypothetical protein
MGPPQRTAVGRQERNGLISRLAEARFRSGKRPRGGGTRKPCVSSREPKLRVLLALAIIRVGVLASSERVPSCTGGRTSESTYLGALRIPTPLVKRRRDWDEKCFAGWAGDES